MFHVFKVSFSGRNGGGAVSVPSVKAGDVLNLYRASGVSALGTSAMEIFKPLVLVDDEIEQVWTSDLSAVTFGAVVFRVS